MKKLILALLVVLVPSPLPAQPPLADKVPADALVYVGWAGTRNLGDGYAQSRLKAVLDASDLPKLFTDFVPRLAQRASGQSPEVRDFAASLSSLAGRMWSHPCAVYFGGIDFSNPNRPQPKLALLCAAGGDAPAIAADLRAALDKAGRSPVPLKVTSTPDNLVMLLVGPVTPPAAGAPVLSSAAAFTDAMSRVHDKPVLSAYVNPAGVVDLIDRSPVKGARARQERENWIKIRDALHLGDARALAWTGTFDGRDWSARAFLAAPAPRKGIWSAIDAKPVSDDALKLVPQTATVVSAGTFDPARLLAGVRATAGQIDPKSPANIDDALDRFRTMTGLDLQRDLLEPLGDQWIAYNDPSVGGSYSFSLALLNKLDDPAKAEQSLVQLGRAAGNFASGIAAKSGMVFAMQETTDNGVTIRYAGLPIVRPAWAIKDGVLYVGIFPQIVSAAIARTPQQGGKTILDNPGFADLRKRLGAGQQPPAAATSIRYLDLPQTVTMMYPTWLFVSGYAGFGDMFGVPVPPMLLPPLNDLAAQLAPAGSISWVDDAGWHARGVSPFPGSAALAGDPSSVAGPALLTSILLPSLNRARETANRVKCAANMRQIGMGILLYSNENRGKYPPDLATILRTQGITIDVFICPSGAAAVPPEIMAANADAQGAWVNDNSAYVYVGQGLTNAAPADRVVLYEKSDNHDEDGMNFLYADGHVEWQTMETAQQLINAARQR